MDPADDNDRAVELVRQFQGTGEVARLAEAVALYRRGVEGTPVGDPELVTYLSNLCGAGQDLFEQTGELGVLAEAVAAGRRAAALIETAGPLASKRPARLASKRAATFRPNRAPPRGRDCCLISAMRCGCWSSGPATLRR